MTRSQEVRDRVLAAVATNDISRRYNKHRWWTSEKEYRTLTDAEKRHLRALVDEGLVVYEGAAGYRHTMIGFYDLTPQGRKALTGSA